MFFILDVPGSALLPIPSRQPDRGRVDCHGVRDAGQRLPLRAATVAQEKRPLSARVPAVGGKWDWSTARTFPRCCPRSLARPPQHFMGHHKIRYGWLKPYKKF